MVAIAFRERRQAGAVEIDPVVVDEVRILSRIHAARLKPDLTLFFIHLFDGAHHPVSFCDLILHLARDAVVEIQVTPAVPLRHPDDFPSVVQFITNLLAGVSRIGDQRPVIDERLAFFSNDAAGLSGCGVHFDDAVHLMSALVVLKRESPAILAPDRIGQAVGIGKQVVVDDDLLFAGEIKKHRLRDIERVSRLCIIAHPVFRLDLIRRR